MSEDRVREHGSSPGFGQENDGAASPAKKVRLSSDRAKDYAKQIVENCLERGPEDDALIALMRDEPDAFEQLIAFGLLMENRVALQNADQDPGPWPDIGPGPLIWPWVDDG